MKPESRLLSYVQMLDSALPIGGFSHSFGLETYVQNGTVATMKDLEKYVYDQIHINLVRVEGLAIKGIYSAISDKDDWKIGRLDKIIHVQRTPKESREGLHKMGKRLLKLAKILYPWMDFDSLEKCLKEYHAFGSLATIHAWAAYHLEIPCNEAVKGYLYTSVVTMVNSGLRLMAIGQTEGQLLIHRSLEVIEDEWEAVSGLNENHIHSFAIAQEIQSMNHETLYSRLFMS